MWTVVYVSQKAEEIYKIKSILEDNGIISRVRKDNTSDEESGTCFEIMVPSAELAVSQNLIIASEI